MHIYVHKKYIYTRKNVYNYLIPLTIISVVVSLKTGDWWLVTSSAVKGEK